MQVTNVALARTDGVGQIGFLDVHVEEVGQELNVVGGKRLHQFDTVGDRRDQVRLVPVQRFVDQWNMVF